MLPVDAFAIRAGRNDPIVDTEGSDILARKAEVLNCFLSGGGFEVSPRPDNEYPYEKYQSNPVRDHYHYVTGSFDQTVFAEFRCHNPDIAGKIRTEDRV